MPPSASADSAATPLERLRWHEGLRRRWREARVEAAVQSAWACSRVEGIALPLELYREHLVTGGNSLPDDSSGVIARGHLRLMVYVDSLLPPLSGAGARSLAPGPQLLTGMHRAACADIANANEIGRPGVAPSVMAGIVADIVSATGGAETSAAVIARIHAAIVNEGVFAQGNIAVAWGMSRLLLVASGVEPTGVAIPERTFATDPQKYRAIVAGDREQWLSYFLQALDEGAESGRRIADMVLAGRTGKN